MTSQELRIGNYVMHQGKVIRVNNISTRSINLEYDTFTHRVVKYIPIDQVSPVYITPYFLISLGFYRKGTLYQLACKKQPPVYITYTHGRHYFNTHFDGNGLLEVEFIHEVQNLVFSWQGIMPEYRKRLF